MASDQNIKKFYPNKFQPSADNGDEDLKRFFDEQDKKDAGQKTVPQPAPQGQVNTQQPQRGVGISDILRALGASNPSLAIHPPSAQETLTALGKPAEQILQGGQQIGQGNPIAGGANILGGVANSIFSPINAGLRYTPQVVQDLAGAIPQGIGTLENAGEQGIQAFLNMMGVPQNVQNLGMEPQQAQEAAQAVHGLNNLAAQFLIPALAGRGAGALMNRGVSPYAEGSDLIRNAIPSPSFVPMTSADILNQSNPGFSEPHLSPSGGAGGTAIPPEAALNNLRDALQQEASGSPLSGTNPSGVFPALDIHGDMSGNAFSDAPPPLIGGSSSIPLAERFGIPGNMNENIRTSGESGNGNKVSSGKYNDLSMRNQANRGTSPQPTSSILANKNKGGLLNAQSVNTPVEGQASTSPYPGYSPPPTPVDGEPLPINAWATKQGLNVSGVKSKIGDSSIAAIKEAYAAYVKDFYNNKAASSSPVSNTVTTQPEVQGAASTSGTNLGESNASNERNIQENRVGEHQGANGNGTTTTPSGGNSPQYGASTQSAQTEPQNATVSQGISERAQGNDMVFSDDKGEIHRMPLTDWDNMPAGAKNSFRELLKKKDEGEVGEPTQTTPTGQAKGIGVDYRVGEGLQKGVEVTTPDGLGNVVRVNKNNVRVRDAKTGEERAYTPEQLQRTDRKLADENGVPLMDDPMIRGLSFGEDKSTPVDNPTFATKQKPSGSLQAGINPADIKETFKNLTDIAPYSDFEYSVGKMNTELNLRHQDLQEWQFRLRKNFNLAEREAMPVYAEATSVATTRGMNVNDVLKEWASDIKDPKLKQKYIDAQTLSDAGKREALLMKQWLKTYGDKLEDVGVLNELRDKYDVLHTVKGKGKYKIGEQRTHSTIHSLETNGMKMRSYDMAELVGEYNDIYSRRLAIKHLMRRLQDARTKSGKVIAHKIQRNPMQLSLDPKAQEEFRRYDKTVVPDWEINPDYAEKLRNIVSGADLNRHPVMKGFKNTALGIKGSLYGLSPFHAITEFLRGLTGFGIVKPEGADVYHPRVQYWLEHGITGRTGLQGIEEGYTHEATNKFVDKFVVKPIMKKFGATDAARGLQGWTQWLFGDYLFNLRVAAAEALKKINDKAYAGELKSGKVTQDQLDRHNAETANNIFGGQNADMIGQNKNVNFLASMVLQSPDFLRSEVRFYKDNISPYGRGAQVVFGRMVAAQLGAMVAIGNALSPLTNGAVSWDWHYSLALTVNAGGKKFYVGFRMLGSDAFDLVSNPPQWLDYRTSSLVHGILELLTGKDWKGDEKNFFERVEDVAGSAVALPFQNWLTDKHKELNDFIRAAESIGIVHILSGWEQPENTEFKSELEPKKGYKWKNYKDHSQGVVPK